MKIKLLKKLRKKYKKDYIIKEEIVKTIREWTVISIVSLPYKTRSFKSAENYIKEEVDKRF